MTNDEAADSIVEAFFKNPNWRTASSTVSTTASAGPTTLDLAKIEALLADIPPEPIGEWMRDQGFPPESCLLILPETFRAQLPVWPRYVWFSTFVESPTLARTGGMLGGPR